MNKTCNILGILGSLRGESYNRGAMQAATELVPPGAYSTSTTLMLLPGTLGSTWS